MVPYDILLHQTTLQNLIAYKAELQSNAIKPGFYLEKHINLLPEKTFSIGKSNEEFLQLILLTKKIICFAENEIAGDGSDWNRSELKILGDISVAMDVDVYDNGVWGVHEKTFKMHIPSITAKLVFTPGPLLHGNRFSGPTPDFNEIFEKGEISQNKYTQLIQRRLLPVFLYASENAKDKEGKALVVLPGLGCGAFAGRFQGKMGEFLNKALQTILEENGTHLKNVACVRFDPFAECEDFEKTFHDVKYRVRRNAGCLGKPQLCSVREYEETENEFTDCFLYKVVAWDHASLPGNDYFVGSRSTDDGVTAAATNSMEVITGVKGDYTKGYYLPPKGSLTWKEVAGKQKSHLVVNRNVVIATSDGTCLELTKFEAQTVLHKEEL